MHIRRLKPDFAVSDMPGPDDFDALQAAGFRTLINFRPDGEAPGQGPSKALQALARRVGLTCIHIPATKFELFTDVVVDAARDAIAHAQGPVLGFCASGQRAAIIWAAAAARDHSVSQILAILKTAGFDLGFLRDDLEAQAGRSQWHAGNVSAMTAQEFEAA